MQTQNVQDDIVDQIRQLAKNELSVNEFYQQLLPRLTGHLNAAGTVAWVCRGDQGTEPLCQHGLEASIGEIGGPGRHRSLLDKVRQAGQPAYVLPRSSDSSSESANPTEYLLGICPVKVDDEVVALLESFHHSHAQPADREAGLKFLRTVAGIAGRFHGNWELRRLRQQQRWSDQFDAFSQAAHASLDPKQTAFAIANEGRLLVGCDRLSVLLRRGNKYRATAISGQDSINRRANSVVLMEQLTARAMVLGEPFHYPVRDAELPPQLADAVENFVDNSHSNALTVFPLTDTPPAEPDDDEADQAGSPPTVIAALIAEQFSGGDISHELVEAVARQASSALGNALEHHRVFLLPLWKAIGNLGLLVSARNLPRTMLGSLLALAVIAALVCWPADFELTAEGTLQPEFQRHAFAPVDGVVEVLKVRHGDQVEPGQTLAELRNSDIDLQRVELQGELQTIGKKLAAKKAARVSISRGSQVDHARLNQLAAEEEELKQWLVSLQRQQELLRKRQQDLRVRSPIRGEVITWDLEDLLTARPVARGNVLMTVAQTDGPWVLELLLPDQRVGHLRTAQRERGNQLDVSYILATSPAVKLNGKLNQVAGATVADDDQGLCWPVTVDVPEEDIPHLRPGAKVTAKIHCGRRPLGYVWLHELIEFFQSRVLFRLS